jgi:hypothetical protein
MATMEQQTADFDLRVRYEVYRFFTEQGRAPTYQTIAQILAAAPERVCGSFHSLHTKHMLFLEPGRDEIRIANPFSAVPTGFQVRAGDQTWWANCAWDTLGIAAATGLDVDIFAHYPDSEQVVTLAVKNGQVEGGGHQVYFPLPCRQWYDDLIFT